MSDNCPHPERNGNHEVYARPDGSQFCRACGAELGLPRLKHFFPQRMYFHSDPPTYGHELAVKNAVCALERAKMVYQYLEEQNVPTDWESRIAHAEAHTFARLRVEEAEAELTALLRQEQNETDRVQEERE